mgnify:CR=1 FL=1
MGSEMCIRDSVTIVSDRTKGAVSDISYKEHIYDAIDASRPNQ